MDKRDFKYTVLMLTKIYFLMIMCIGIPGFILFRIIHLIFNGGSIETLFSDIISSIGGLFFAILFLTVLIYTIIGIVYIFVKIKRKREQLYTEMYVRELPKYFPPAIVSFLFDLSMESSTDYTATIAYLISKKYIEFIDNGVKILNNNIENLSSHEKYVFNCLTKKSKYNHSEFIKYVMDDALGMGLIQKGKRRIHFFRNIGLAILTFFVSGMVIQFVNKGIIYYLFTIIGVVSEISIFAVVGYSIYLVIKYKNENFYRTSLGNIEAKRWSGVKKYLSNFTLMDQKELSDIKLYDDYIPYAIALNESKTIEKYIEDNDSYRKLIYGNIYNLDN